MDLPLAVPFDSIGLFSPYQTVESLSSEIPFSINANARYHIIKDVVPGEDGYLSLSMGVAFAI